MDHKKEMIDDLMNIEEVKSLPREIQLEIYNRIVVIVNTAQTEILEEAENEIGKLKTLGLRPRALRQRRSL